MSPSSSQKGKTTKPPGPIDVRQIFDEDTYFGFKTNDLREAKSQAVLGFMSMNVVDPPTGAFWGKFNNRVLDKKWVERMADSFVTNVDNCSEDYCMDVALDPDWLENKDKILPKIDGVTEGSLRIKGNNLWILSGKHRRIALVLYIKRMKEEIESLKAYLEEQMQVKDEDEVVMLDEEWANKRTEAEARVEHLEHRIEKSCLWSVRIYDRAKIEREYAHSPEKIAAIFRLISRNTVKGDLRATEEELLQEVLDELKDAFEADAAGVTTNTRDDDFTFKYPEFIVKVAQKAAGFKPSAKRYKRICVLPSFALGLVMASRIPSHYMHAPWFKVSSLQEMVGVHGAFISEFIIQSVEFLERIANPNEPPLNFNTIECIKHKFLENPNNTPELQTSLRDMEVAFQNPGNLSSWSPEILDIIDQVFVKNYVQEDGEPVSFLFFPKNVANLNRFMTYCSEVDQVLRANPNLSPPYARTYFSYYSIRQMRGLPFPVPLGTASVVDILNRMTKKLKAGFTEVISWTASSISWAPLLNLKSKPYMCWDQFNSMVEAISKDVLLNTTDCGLRRKIFTLFFSHLTTSIAEIDIYLAKNKTGRERVNSILGFNDLAAKAKKAVAEGDGSTHKGKGKNKSSSASQSSSWKDPESIVISLGSTAVDYGYIWMYINELMAIKSFDHDHRVATRIGERMLVMSGLNWNRDSRSRGRDWNNITSAVALETILVQLYREDLLKACPGACVLRDEMRDYFITIAEPHHVADPSSRSGTKVVRKWDFPDGIATPIGARASGLAKTYDPDAMRKWTDEAKPSQAKDKRKLQRTINGLLKNKLLWSDSTLSPGTLETLAYRSIATLWKVRYPFERRNPSPAFTINVVPPLGIHPAVSSGEDKEGNQDVEMATSEDEEEGDGDGDGDGSVGEESDGENDLAVARMKTFRRKDSTKCRLPTSPPSDNRRPSKRVSTAHTDAPLLDPTPAPIPSSSTAGTKKRALVPTPTPGPSSSQRSVRQKQAPRAGKLSRPPYRISDSPVV